MRKFVKWFVFWLLVLCGLALAICYIAIPQQTKSAIDIVIGYLNTPLGIAGGTTITLGLVASVIVKLVYDRYKTSINTTLEQAKQFAESKKQEAKEYHTNALKVQEEVKEMLSSYSTRIDELTNKLAEVCETSPNAKIKALGSEIKNGSDKLKEELKTKLEEVNNDFVATMEEKVNVKELETRVNELTQQLERLVEQYGRKETTND